MLHGKRDRSRALLALALLFLAGCAGTVMDVDTLRAEGYRRSTITEITPSGKRVEVENYELWFKENREAARTVRLCLVPKVAGAGYNWRVTVFVNDKETWSYESGRMYGNRQTVRQLIDCTVSGSLPEGRLNWQVNYVYWQ